MWNRSTNCVPVHFPPGAADGALALVEVSANGSACMPVCLVRRLTKSKLSLPAEADLRFDHTKGNVTVRIQPEPRQPRVTIYVRERGQTLAFAMLSFDDVAREYQMALPPGQYDVVARSPKELRGKTLGRIDVAAGAEHTVVTLDTNVQ